MKRHMDDVEAFEKVGFTNQQAHALVSLLGRISAQFDRHNHVTTTTLVLVATLVAGAMALFFVR